MFTKIDIEDYFLAFKNEQLYLIILGAVALIIAVIFYTGLKTIWFKGFALPLAVFALLNMGAGFSNYKKADVLKIRTIYNADLHPELLKTKELPRIYEIKQNLSLLIYVNISIIFAAAFIYFYFKKKDKNEYYMGVAAALFLVAALSIVNYTTMKNNTNNYEKKLLAFTQNIKI